MGKRVSKHEKDENSQLFIPFAMSTIKDYAEKYHNVSKKNDYSRVTVIKEEWHVLSDSVEIDTYLPKENKITITTGITNQKNTVLNNFESIDLSDTMPNKRGHIINTGASVWALDFVPKTADLHDFTQYLAVGGYNTVDKHYTFSDKTPCKNAIQIWQYSTNTDECELPHLELCLLHGFGVIHDFKWCPFSVYEKDDRLGILAALFNDGEIRVFVVPHPQRVRKEESIAKDQTVYIKVETPRLTLELPRTHHLCFAWGDYNKLACGTRSGNVVVWDILNSLLSQSPIVSINIPSASIAPIRSICWPSLFDCNALVYSDTRGFVFVCDLLDPFIPLKIFRIRSTYVCLTGTGHGSGFLFGDTEGISRKNLSFYSKKTTTLTVHNSLIWSIAVNPFHGVVATTGSDGSVMVKPFSSDAYKATPKHKLNVLEYTLYKLDFCPDTRIFQYMDGLKPKTNLPEKTYHNILADPITSIHKAAWNTNKDACGWVASGGEGGLCRIEFTGCQ